MNINEEIELARAAVSQAELLKIATTNRLYELCQQRDVEKYDIKPGDKVKSRRGVIGIVHCLKSHTSYMARPWLAVHVLKKDGTPRADVQTFYEWDKVEGAE